MQIVDKVQDYITENTTLYAMLSFELLPSANEALAIRQDPSSATEVEYIDRSRSGSFNFTVYAKSLSMVKAVNQLHAIEDILDLPNGIKFDADLEFSKVEIVSPAYWIEKTVANEYIYCSTFKLSYNAWR